MKWRLFRSASARAPGDNRNNFAQVPAMTRPIPPPPKPESQPQAEAAEKHTKTDQVEDGPEPMA